MKICLIQKYPPIQGGISRDAFLQSLALVKAGHDVFVVTNSLEVEINYRCFDTSIYEDIGLDSKPENTGRLNVFSTQTRRGHFVIPKVNPSVTKLTSLATHVVEKYGCDLIVGFYFEPYAMAAYITSTYTGVPFGVMHGGRDIGQLLACPDLYIAYKKLLEKADFIIATSTIRGKLNFMGIDITKVFYQKPVNYFSPFFSNTKSPMDLNLYRQIILKHFPGHYAPELYKELAQKHINPDIPVIGMYSKSGKLKGFSDLLKALSIVKQAGKAFHFIAVIQGEYDELKRISNTITSLNLDDYVWVFPFMPYWHIGHFIRSCTAVCFLEKNFGITFHMPKIQDEVLASSRCLIMSDEIARKQPYRHHIRNGENCFVVDPQEINDLATTILDVVSNPEKADQIAQNGYHSLFLPFERKEDTVVSAINQMFSDVVEYLKLSNIDQVKSQLTKAIHLNYRHLFKCCADIPIYSVSDYCNRIQTREPFVDLLIDFGDYILKQYVNDSSDIYKSELIRYCQVKIRSQYNKIDPRYSSVINIDSANKPITLESSLSLFPDVMIEDFKFDIPKALQDSLDLKSMPEGHYSYAFQAAGNYHPDEREFYISPTVRDILDLCAANVTTKEILNHFSTNKKFELLSHTLMDLLKDLQKKLLISLR